MKQVLEDLRFPCDIYLTAIGRRRFGGLVFCDQMCVAIKLWEEGK